MRCAEFSSMHLLPGAVRIECHHGLGIVCGRRSKILLEPLPGGGHHERHDAAGLVLGWISQYCESAGHLVVDDVILCTAPGMLPLRFQNPIVIAMKRRPFADWFSSVVAFVGRVGNQCARGTFRLTLFDLPVQAVFGIGLASETLRVNSRLVA